MHPLLKLIIEIGPLAAFFITFNQLKDSAGDSEALIWATGVFMIAQLVSVTASWALTRKIPRMAIITTVLVLVFGGLTIWLND